MKKKERKESVPSLLLTLPCRFDASGNVVEHYSDGDLVNQDSPFERQPAGPESLYVWGPNIPLSFMSGKLGDVGKTLVAPPNVSEAKPAQYEDLPKIVA